MTRARLAYVNARMRARKARLLTRDDLVRLALSDNPAGVVPGWRDLAPDRDAAEILVLVYQRLTAEYAMAVAACPDARAPLLALVRLHEIENVKLVWRAITRGTDAGLWSASWRPLGSLATVSRETCAGATTLRSLVEVLARTPYAEAAATVARAHPTDLGAAEAALDRWSAADLARAVARMPTRERASRVLLSLAGRQRDAAVRARRAAACRRALQGSPYSLAPLVAYLLLRDAEARALVSVAETRGRPLEAPEVRRTLDAVM